MSKHKEKKQKLRHPVSPKGVLGAVSLIFDSMTRSKSINFSLISPYLFKVSKITINFFDLFTGSKNVLLKQVSYSESEADSNLVIISVSDSDSDFESD